MRLVRELMTSDVEVVDAEATLQTAAERMKHRDVGFLPVVQSDRLVGLLTDRDLTTRAMASGLDPNRTHVSDIMTPRIWWIYEDQPVEDAGFLMQDKKVRRLIVLNREQQPIGVLSLGDIAVHAAEQPTTAGEVLRRVSEPAHPR
jgi:CBS domain-containing protein